MPYLDIDNLQAVFLDDDALRARHLARLPCGPVQITSGRVVACDPLVQPERQPFARELQARGASPSKCCTTRAGMRWRCCGCVTAAACAQPI